MTSNGIVCRVSATPVLRTYTGHRLLTTSSNSAYVDKGQSSAPTTVFHKRRLPYYSTPTQRALTVPIESTRTHLCKRCDRVVALPIRHRSSHGRRERSRGQRQRLERHRGLAHTVDCGDWRRRVVVVQCGLLRVWGHGWFGRGGGGWFLLFISHGRFSSGSS